MRSDLDFEAKNVRSPVASVARTRETGVAVSALQWSLLTHTKFRSTVGQRVALFVRSEMHCLLVARIHSLRVHKPTHQ
jgi:hypothetical protein